MTDDTLASAWGKRFGLARSPMFAHDQTFPGQHDVLLDGGNGSFALSVLDELPNPSEAASWAWSSDLPHHVAVARETVQVVRWDDVRASQRYSYKSVESDLPGFYRYLRESRLRSTRNVVRHLMSLFGRIRTLVARAGLSDSRATDALVTVLGDLIVGIGKIPDNDEFGLPADAADLRNTLAGPQLEEALVAIRSAPEVLEFLKLHPSLAIRHAGGQLFQAAHFDLVRAPPPDLFGFVEEASAKPNAAGGTHFTPPALARAVVDHCIAQLSGLENRPHLTVADPACGSAAFLHEALRGLQRVGYHGSLKFVGRDVSGPAVAMARFTMALAFRDWQPAGGVKMELGAGDSLAAPSFPSADFMVMNPPFISVIAQNESQKAQLRAVVGERAGARGDYCMAFVTKALDALEPGGILGTLFPANLLTHGAVTPWRSALARKGSVSLLGSIGDFGIFSQALVHVACAAIAKPARPDGEFTAFVTGNDSEATSDALRELRKANGVPPVLASGDRNWKLFAANRAVLATEAPWRILTPDERAVLDALEEAQTPTVSDLFEVSQGVQTGNLGTFLFDETAFRRLGLPKKEHRFFRPALMTDSIENGQIIKPYRLFYPHTQTGPLFDTEDEMRAAVQTYYRKVLEPNRAKLEARKAITTSQRTDWWGLMRPRAGPPSRPGAFAFDHSPRIVSKFFGSEGSFALDLGGDWLPSTGHVWRPRSQACPQDAATDEEETARAATAGVLRSYVTLLNSGTFMKLVSFRSVVVSGGQYDLSSRFVNHVFLPDLWRLSRDPTTAAAIQVLAERGGASRAPDPALRRHIDDVVARLYGVRRLAEV